MQSGPHFWEQGATRQSGLLTLDRGHLDTWTEWRLLKIFPGFNWQFAFHQELPPPIKSDGARGGNGNHSYRRWDFAAFFLLCSSVIWRKTRKWSRLWQWRCWNAVDLNASISCESCAHIWEAELRFMRTVVTLLSLAGYGVPALPWPEYGTRDPLHNPLLHILFPPCQFFASLCPRCLFVSLWRIYIESLIL